MIVRCLLLFQLFVSQSYSQQNKYHFIIQNKFNERLPYASLFWEKSTGFSANAMGILSVTTETPIDSIFVSSIGYKTLHTAIRQLQIRNDSIVVILSPQESVLPTLTIFSSSKDRDIGIDERQTSFFSNNYRSMKGVVKVNQPGKVCQIESVSIFINKKSAENIPFRLRIYTVAENGYPGEDLLRENIIIDSYTIGDWNTVFLNDSSIIIEQPIFFIGIEWLNLPQKMSNGALQIGLTNKIKEAHSYFQFANRGWRLNNTINETAPDNLMIKAKIKY
jgi:hypothetical protein